MTVRGWLAIERSQSREMQNLEEKNRFLKTNFDPWVLKPLLFFSIKISILGLAGMAQ